MAENVFLTTATDEDYSTAANWSLEHVPQAGEDVRIPAGAGSISLGLDQSAVAIGDFVVETGYTGTIGTADTYLEIDPDSFDFAGTGKSFIDVGAAAIDLVVRNTASAITGSAGLTVNGSAIAHMDVRAGNVRVNSAATVATITTGRGAQCLVSSGADVTTFNNMGGTSNVEIASGDTVTTINNDSGTVTTTGAGSVTTIDCDGGTVISNATGTVTLAQADGGTIDFTQSRIARTVTNGSITGNGQLKWIPDVITWTNVPSGEAAVSLRGATS